MHEPMISFVSPVYRCRDCLEKLTEEIGSACSKLGASYEILLINDDCPENSWQKITEIAGRNPFVKGIRLSRNFGQHSAIEAGLSAVRGEWIVVLDCDLQDTPRFLPSLYEAAQDGADLVLVKRKSRTDGFLRTTFSSLFYKTLCFLTGRPLSPEIANFGIYHRRVIDAYNSWKEEQKYFPVMIQWLGFEQKTIDLPHAARFAGKSSYNFWSLLKLGATIVLSFSDRPLWIMAIAGAIVAALVMILGIVYLVLTLIQGTDVQGWASLILSIWFIGGVNILAAGMIGIYLGRVLRESKGRPSFIIAQTINMDSELNLDSEQ